MKLKEKICVKCESTTEVIHFPITGFFGDDSPMCAECYHGTSAENAWKHESCEECAEYLGINPDEE